MGEVPLYTLGRVSASEMAWNRHAPKTNRPASANPPPRGASAGQVFARSVFLNCVGIQ